MVLRLGWIPIYCFFFGLVMPFTQAADDKKEEKKFVAVKYYKHPYGHIHQNPSRYSTSLTTVGCGHPVKIYALKKKGQNASLLILDDWHYVSVGPYEGYMEAEALEDKKPICLQAQYPKFFDELKLEIADFYYWGKLYDHYFLGKSKIGMGTKQ